MEALRSTWQLLADEVCAGPARHARVRARERTRCLTRTPVVVRSSLRPSRRQHRRADARAVGRFRRSTIAWSNKRLPWLEYEMRSPAERTVPQRARLPFARAARWSDAGGALDERGGSDARDESDLYTRNGRSPRRARLEPRRRAQSTPRMRTHTPTRRERGRARPLGAARTPHATSLRGPPLPLPLHLPRGPRQASTPRGRRRTSCGSSGRAA